MFSVSIRNGRYQTQTGRSRHDRRSPAVNPDVDVDNGFIETQLVDGDLEEVELNEWRQLVIEPVAAPEDWSGPIDSVERDEAGGDGAAAVDEEVSRLLQGTPPNREQSQEYDPEPLQDDLGEGYPAEQPLADVE